MFERRPSDSRIDLNGGLRIRSGFSAGAVATYAAVLRDTYAASEVWPLVNISAGTTISAFINSARNGTLTGWALQNAPGPVTGTLAPLSDGITDVGNIYTSGGGIGLADIFDPLEGNIVIHGRASGAGVWTDGVIRTLLRLRADNNNDIYIRKPAANNAMDFRYRAGSVSSLRQLVISTTDWFHFALTWSKSNNRCRAYLNGVQSGADLTGLGVWAGALATTTCTIGASGSGGADSWSGLDAYVGVKFGAEWSPTDVANIYAAAATAGPDL